MCRVPVASRKSRQRVPGVALVPVELEPQQPVQVPGGDGQGGIEVDVEGDATGEGVEVEPADIGVQLVLGHHPLGVAGEKVLAGAGEVVGDDQGGLVAADVLDRDLVYPGADAGELDHVFAQAGPPVAAGPGDGDCRPAPGGQGIQPGKFGLAALAQGEPADAAAGQLVEALAGGQLGVEDQQPRPRSFTAA
jgi:hypothetical protein